MTSTTITVAASRRRMLAFGAGAALLPPLLGACAAPRSTAAPATVRVKIFPGAQNLALFTALKEGFFEREQLAVQLQFTQNSVELREGLAAGAFDIAHSAVDNAVAMRETAGADVVILCGGDNSMNELFVQADIATVQQLRGRALIVDAPNTAYALQARKILKDNRLKEGDYEVKSVGGTFQRIKAMQTDRANAASMLNPPFSLQARASGLRSLGRVVDLIGPYQASGAFAMRPWAEANSDVLERYLAALVRALRWATDPSHRKASIAVLVQRLEISMPLAELTYAALVEPHYGLTPDVSFDTAGFANLLSIRAELEGQRGGPAPPQSRYVDLRWYQRAMRRL